VDVPSIRSAATAICVRDGRDGDPEVLVVERSAASRFLPGYVAFPGGAVEPADASSAARWFGNGGEVHRAAAIRELIEEVGLAMTAGGLIRSGSHQQVDEMPPAADRLVEICHWVAPEEVPIRFDARYFVVSAGPGLEPEPDGAEVVRAWWTSPRALLAEWVAGARKLYWPTWFTVSELAACTSVDTVIALRFTTREPDAEEIAAMPSHVTEQG
jgi:8-oxo-dGTP pyrophosphatase MutT (NUDIX family)